MPGRLYRGQVLEELVVVGKGDERLRGAEIDVEHKELGVLTRDQEQAAIVRVEVG